MSTPLDLKSVTTPKPEGLVALCGGYAGRVRELLEKGWGRVGPGLAKDWYSYTEMRANGERLESGRMKRAFR
jgi:hypothetical protein